MRLPRLTTLLVTTLLAGAPSYAALAKPAITAHSKAQAPSATTPSDAPRVHRAASSDAERYAKREAKNKAVANFEGGHSVLIIGGSTVAIVLLIVVLVIVL